jgi:hypothetical protein
MWVYLTKVLPYLTGKEPGEGQFLFPHFPGQTVNKENPNYLNVQVIGAPTHLPTPHPSRSLSHTVVG